MRLFNLVGILAAGRLLLGQAATAISNKVDYRFLPIRISDFSVVIKEGKISVKTPLRFELLSKLPVNISAEQITFNVSQGGASLGQANTTTDIQLIPNQPRTLAFDLFIGAGSFLDQVQDHQRGEGSVFDPIKVSGSIQFDNGLTLPISRTITILSVQ